MSAEDTNEPENNNAVQFPEGGAEGQEPTMEQKVEFLLKNHVGAQNLQQAFEAINKDIKLIALRQENLELKLLRPRAEAESEKEGDGAE